MAVPIRVSDSQGVPLFDYDILDLGDGLVWSDGENSSDSSYDIVHLANGRTVRWKHPVCHRCGVNLDKGLEVDSEDNGDFDRTDLEWDPAYEFKVPRLQPPARPDTLFEHRSHGDSFRFLRKGNDKEFLVYTDGACLYNGSAGAQGGCGVVWHGTVPGQSSAGRVSIHLEFKGPNGTGKPPQTCNRAELRAVLLALELCNWASDGFKSMVIATDSRYVAKGLTVWCRKWLVNDWKKCDGGDVANQDLLKAILERVALLKERSMRVRFWHIPREWNRDADKIAKKGVEEPQRETYERIRLSDLGVLDGIADFIPIA